MRITVIPSDEARAVVILENDELGDAPYVRCGPDGTVALIDLGSVGRLTKDDRQGLMHLLHAVQVQDAEMLTDAILQVVDRSDNL